jgi:peroxiredoxin
VLLFFPLAFSSVCTEELCAVRDDWSAWTALDADVFGISVDSPFVTRRFREELGLPFPLLSDFNHVVGASYGVLYEDYFGLRGVARRAAFVVDMDGRIAYAWVSERDDVLPDFAAVRTAVRHAMRDRTRTGPGAL